MMEAKQLAQWGIIATGGLMLVSIVMLGLLAILRDGEVTPQVVQLLAGVVGWGLPVLGVLVVGGQTAAAVITVKTNGPTAAPMPMAAPAAPAASPDTPVAPVAGL